MSTPYFYWEPNIHTYTFLSVQVCGGGWGGGGQVSDLRRELIQFGVSKDD